MGMDKKIESTPLPHWRYAVGGLLVLVVLAYLVLSPSTGKTFTIDGERLSISTVKMALFEDYLPLRVNVQPFKSVYLDAIEGGRVDKIFVEEGDMVEEGQKLLLLSNTSLQLDIISREAQVSEQLNNLRNTKLAIERNRLDLKRELIELDYQIKRLKQSVSRREKVAEYIGVEELQSIKDELVYYQQRREVTLESQVQEERMRLAQIEQLEGNVVQLEQNLIIARSNLDNLTVTAPRAGRLTSFNVEIGETKTRGERLGQIDDTNRFKVTGQVSEYYLNRLALGQFAKVDINDDEYTLELSKIYPEIRNNEFEIDLTFVTAPPKTIRRGQTLTPRLILSDEESVLQLDNGAFIQVSAGNWVFLLDKNGKTAYKHDVKLGRRTPNQIEIKQGLQVGDRVIVSSYKNFNKIDRILIEE